MIDGVGAKCGTSSERIEWGKSRRMIAGGGLSMLDGWDGSAMGIWVGNRQRVGGGKWQAKGRGMSELNLGVNEFGFRAEAVIKIKLVVDWLIRVRTTIIKCPSD